MNAKSYRILAVSILLLSLSIFWIHPVSASGAVPLWYEFHVGRYADQAASHVTVTLPNHNGCAGSFQIFANGPWDFWATPAEEDWIGTGSDAGYGMTTWASDLVPGTYYVRMGTGASPACAPGISGVAVDRVKAIDLGPGFETAVTSPEPPSPSIVTAQKVNIPIVAADADFLWTEPDKIAVAHNPGPASHTGPEMAMRPGEWMPVMDNEPHMFSFYVGAVDGDNTSSVSITLHAAPWKGGQFQVFPAGNTPWGEPVAEYQMGHSYQIEGQDPAWYGELVPGGYQVRVEAQGVKECLLAISGNAVRY